MYTDTDHTCMYMHDICLFARFDLFICHHRSGQSHTSQKLLLVISQTLQIGSLIEISFKFWMFLRPLCIDIVIVYDIFIDLILVDLDEKLHTFYILQWRATKPWVAHLAPWKSQTNHQDQQEVKIEITVYLGVSKNNGTPKSSILIGFSIINHPFWATPIFGNTHFPVFRLSQGQWGMFLPRLKTRVAPSPTCFVKSSLGLWWLTQPQMASKTQNSESWNIRSIQMVKMITAKSRKYNNIITTKKVWKSFVNLTYI